MSIWANIRRAFGANDNLDKQALHFIKGLDFPAPLIMRDKNQFKDVPYFEAKVRDKLGWARYLKDNDQKHGHKHVKRSYGFCIESYVAFLEAGYTAGLPLKWISSFLPEIVAALEYFDPICQQQNSSAAHGHILDSNARGFAALTILSFCIGLQCDPRFTQRMLPLLGESGRAPLHDRIAARFDPEWKIGSEFKTYKEYKLLVQAIDGPRQEAPALIKKYLSIWYLRVFSDTGGYNNHDSLAYVGYWCWEAALVVMLWGIDDSSFKGHKYYPDELVEYYRQR